MKIVKGNKKDLRPAVKEIDDIMKKRYKIKNVVLGWGSKFFVLYIFC